MRHLDTIMTITLASVIFIGTSTYGQFREIGTDRSESIGHENLQPTKSKFVSPKSRVKKSTAKSQRTAASSTATAKSRAQSPKSRKTTSKSHFRKTERVARSKSTTQSSTFTGSSAPKSGTHLIQPERNNSAQIRETKNAFQAPAVKVDSESTSQTKSSSATSQVPQANTKTRTTAPAAKTNVPTRARQQSSTLNSDAINATRKETTSATQQSQATVTKAAPIDPFTLFQKTQAAEGEFEPLTFNGVTVGQTSFSEVKQLWGKPAKIIEINGMEKLLYAVEGVRQIGVLADGVDALDENIIASSIEIHVKETKSPTEYAKSLGIEANEPVEVLDSEGSPLGLVYPESGVLFGYGDSREKVRTISIEPIRAEAFVMRAEDKSDLDYTQDLADLDTAISMNESDAHAHWLRAELLAKVGDSDAAFESARQAVLLDDLPEYRLTKARLEAEIGSQAKSKREIQAIVEDGSASPIVLARTHYELGNRLATGPDASFEKAMESHLEAIDVAAPERKSDDYKIRRIAKRVLVDSHIAVAQDIALGNYQRKTEVVPKWLVRASELAENYIDKEGGDSSVRLDIFRATLGIYSILPGNFDASVAAEDALTEGRRLIGISTDESYQRTIQRKLIETLYYAAKVEQRRGRTETAKGFTDKAIALLAQQEDADRSSFDDYVAGQIYFLAGSINAIGESDHKTACEYYAKAYKIFEKNDITSIVKRSNFGEQYVSMGISHWESGDKEFGIEITEKGAKLMEEAVQDGTLPLVSLSVPYGNLATMHKELGNKKDVKHYTEMMAKVAKNDEKLR